MWREWTSPMERVALGGDGCSLLEPNSDSGTFFNPAFQGLALFVPENLAENYDYPLVCYLHDNNHGEQDVWNWFPEVSEQNFIAAGIRAPFPHPRGLPGQFLWKDHRADAGQAAIRDAVQTVRQEWNIHPQRITLFGEGRGALVALQQFLISQSPSDTAEIPIQGVICRDLPACWPRLLPPVPHHLDGRLLLLDSIRTGDGLAAIDGLSEAGMEISIQGLPRDATAQAINRWLLAPISTTVY